MFARAAPETKGAASIDSDTRPTRTRWSFLLTPFLIRRGHGRSRSGMGAQTVPDDRMTVGGDLIEHGLEGDPFEGLLLGKTSREGIQQLPVVGQESDGLVLGLLEEPVDLGLHL